jgi:hypothetical protein
VTRDGTTVDPSDFGTPVSVDTGAHEIHASAPGFAPWTGHARTYRAANVILVIPELRATAAPTAAAPAAHAETPPAPAAKARVSEETRNRPSALDQNRRTLQLVSLAGVGLGAILTGTSFAIFTSTNNDAKSICPAGSTCTPGDVSHHAQLIDDARLARTFTYVGIGVTAAALASFAIVSFVPFERKDDAVRATISAGASPDGSFGASMQGTF